MVTGTGTEVGKTVVTAALAASYAGAGARVAVVKPVQTGVRADEPGDAHEVSRLSGVSQVCELTRLADPLAPDSAARLRGIVLPGIKELAERILGRFSRRDCSCGRPGSTTTAISARGKRPEVQSRREEDGDGVDDDGVDVVLIEGAGGVLVRLDGEGGTIADLAVSLRDAGAEVEVLVVAVAGLGTLNHTELTVEALRSRGLEPRGVVIGSWPAEPGLAERCNLGDLPAVADVPLLGTVPEGAGSLPPVEFRRRAPDWLGPSVQSAVGLRAAIVASTASRNAGIRS
ncbi:MAG: AAA family ATPase [Propionibacteriales bacterium]|nr:AAA family ATPase [Propionibacteriales bacterium]